MKRMLLLGLALASLYSSRGKTIVTNLVLETPDQALVGTNTIDQRIAQLQQRVARSLATLSATAPLDIMASTNTGGLAPTSIGASDAEPATYELRPEEITISGTTAQARFGPHQATFAADLDSAEAMRLVMPGGGELRSRIFGLCYVDQDTGESVLIAEPKSCIGQVQQPNRIVYRSAFDDAAVDVVYTYTRTSLEQDVIIRRQLPAPAELGLAGRNIHLCVLTEFFNPPLPKRIPQRISLLDAKPVALDSIEPAIEDESLIFGSMRVVEGKAFSFADRSEVIPVGKSWRVLQGRHFLVESTPLALLQDSLDALPKTAGLSKPRKVQSLETLVASASPGVEPKPGHKSFQLAQSSFDTSKGVVIDYLIVNSPLLNVDFAGASKVGFAAIGQSASDYWNASLHGLSLRFVPNLKWSDQTVSSIGLIVSNAPGGWGGFSDDTMYDNYVYGGPNMSVSITNLPNNRYNFYLYGHDGDPGHNGIYDLKRAGTSLGQKGTSIWGWSGLSTNWEEGQQFIAFKNVAVTNQTIRFDVIANSAGWYYLNGMQIAVADAVPVEAVGINNLMNLNFPGATPDKVGFAAVGLTTTDFWNEVGATQAGHTGNLKWSDQTTSTAGIVVLNAPTFDSRTLSDQMYRNFINAEDGGGITVTITNLPTGNYNFYLYGHGQGSDDNALFELWSDEVGYGIRATSLWGSQAATTDWEEGQQFVVYRDVAVTENHPVVIHTKHNGNGYQNLCGMQIVRKGELDADADGLPDGFEMKWFGNLDQTATADFDGDGLMNIREYQLGLDPERPDANRNGIADIQEPEIPWVDEGTPVGGYEYSMNESWSWTGSWYDGDGWGGNELYAYSGSYFHVSELVPDDAHQHYFSGSQEVIRAGTGDVLYCYVNLDSSYPPDEVMLQWYVKGNNGYESWEHRAYWGANSLAWGVDETEARHYVGELPTAGEWVRLEVPASAVGLEGKIIEGMAFALYGGRVAWDKAGKLSLDYDGDGLLDSWEMEHFGSLTQAATSDQGENWDYDKDDISNLDEYLNGSDPNTIQFYTLFDNLFVCGNLVAGAVTALAGVPDRMALLADNTDFASASWANYASNFTKTIGSTDGKHTVYVGLKGRSPSSKPTWVGYRVARDTVAPSLVITNPVPGVVFQPLLQIQGYSPEPLTSLRYSISNAAAVLTNREGFVVKQFVDTNTMTITTNWFACWTLS